MRVVAGELKGRAIESPSGETTRPTTDRVRESMFSSIYSRISDLSNVRVLDAFAGSGALGIEALSRGAHSCVFFEHDTAARAVLQGNLSRLGLQAPRATAFGKDVIAEAAVGGASLEGSPFRLVLVDPPYALAPADVCSFAGSLCAHGMLAPGCVVVYEHALQNKAAVEEIFSENSMFEVTGQKKYGKIGVTYLRYAGA